MILFRLPFTLLLALCCLPFFSLAQENEPSLRVQAAFKAKYPDAQQVRWEAGHEVYDVHFLHQQKTARARYGQAGNWLITRIELREGDLPSATKNYLKENYPQGYTFQEAVRIQEPRGGRLEVRLREGSTPRLLRFDSEGQLIGEGEKE